MELKNLSGEWTYHYDKGGASSPAPIFIGLMALAGAYLVKDGIRYLLLKDDCQSEEANSIEEKKE